MSANPSDEALQRLNYFNGQRLAAADFRAEQDYHVAMRRVLNRSLYSPGIVAGFEVVPDPEDAHRVIVQHGLAFDNLGREIFLPADVSVQVVGTPRSAPGVVFGNLLVVSYREMRQFPAQTNCQVGAPYRPCSGSLAWGAPTRIVADAVFEFLESWPSDESGKVVLSQLELRDDCGVERTSSSVRKYAVPSKAPVVTPIAIEGEKDIDPNNPKVLIFHVRGGTPTAATLVLRSGRFSTLHYSELAAHSHTADLQLSTQPGVNAHTHSLGELKTDKKLHPDSIGFESLVHFGDPNDYCVRLWDGANGAQPTDLTALAHFKAKNTEHDHLIASGATTDAAGSVPAHTHTFTSNGLAKAGQLPDLLRTGDGYNYFDKLRVEIDGVDLTDSILAQLKANGTDWPTIGLGALGDANHALVTLGTGDIDLLQLPSVDLLPGLHTLKFTPTAGGGQIHYNLYVE